MAILLSNHDIHTSVITGVCRRRWFRLIWKRMPTMREVEKLK